METFRGQKMYYVTNYSNKEADRTAAIKEVSKRTKMRRDLYTVVTVWIQYDVDGWDLLWLEPVKDAAKMMAVVRR